MDGMRVALPLLLLLHALLHVLGFLKLWGLAALPEMSGKMLVPLSESLTRAVGIGWLLVSVSFLTAAALYVVRNEHWWVVAVSSTLLSQGLIILQWQDAKAGTLANVLVLAAVAFELTSAKR